MVERAVEAALEDTNCLGNVESQAVQEVWEVEEVGLANRKLDFHKGVEDDHQLMPKHANTANKVV